MIDFKVCNFSQYPQKSIESILLEKYPTLNFYHSRSKIVFSFDEENHEYIYKIPKRLGSEARAQALFRFALKEDVGCFFLKNMLVYQYKDIEIYCQKKVQTVLQYDFNHPPSLKIKTLCQHYIENFEYNAKEESCYGFYYWIEQAVKEYGENKVKKLLNFCEEYVVLDLLPEENIGFLGNLPFIIDYDVCFCFDFKERGRQK